MGCRALVQFVKRSGKDREIKGGSPVVYLHNHGYMVKAYLYELGELMATRPNDESYACARFIGICHSHDAGSALSLGIWSANALEDGILGEADSHGDLGVWVVNCDTWEVETYDNAVEWFSCAKEAQFTGQDADDLRDFVGLHYACFSEFPVEYENSRGFAYKYDQYEAWIKGQIKDKLISLIGPNAEEEIST